MNTKRIHETAKTVATGVIVSGIALASLGVTGCSNLSVSQVAAMASEATAHPENLVDFAGKLSANHNETFLMGATV